MKDMLEIIWLFFPAIITGKTTTKVILKFTRSFIIKEHGFGN